MPLRLQSVCPYRSYRPAAVSYTHLPEQPEEETQGNIGGILLIVLILAGGGGAAFYYFKVLKPKKDAAKGNDNLDEYDFDDYDEDEEVDGELPDEQEDETV